MCKKDWRLLQAYKATGLTPEQITELITKSYGPLHITLARALELAEAEENGLIVVLPWKPGDVIYEADTEHGAVKHELKDFGWVMNSAATDDAGNTWYDYWTNEDVPLAHKDKGEAEAALKERELHD